MTKPICDFCGEDGNENLVVKMGRFCSCYESGDIIFRNVCDRCAKEVREFLKGKVKPNP